MFFLNSKITTVLLAVVFVWILFSVMSVEVEKNATKTEESIIKNKIINVKKDNEFLESQIQNFEKGEFLEKEARLRLNYKVSDEEVAFVHRDINSQKASLSAEFFEEPPNYKKWWYYLFGY